MFNDVLLYFHPPYSQDSDDKHRTTPASELLLQVDDKHHRISAKKEEQRGKQLSRQLRSCSTFCRALNIQKYSDLTLTTKSTPGQSGQLDCHVSV